MAEQPSRMAQRLATVVTSTLASIAVAACGLAVSTPSLSPTGTSQAASSAPSPSGTSTGGSTLRAETQEGPFRLTFELPKDTWSAGEAIQGHATLSLAAGSAADIGGSGGGLIGFDFAEVDGTRHMDAVFTMDCHPYHLVAGRPMSTPIVKSVGFEASDPNAAFYQAWYSEPEVHLPAGTWTIRAVTSFVDGTGCSGASHDLRAPVVVTVLPATGSPLPSPTR